MTDGPTLDQPTLTDCRVVDGCGQTDCADETHTVRPMTVDDLIGLVKQLEGATETRWCSTHQASGMMSFATKCDFYEAFVLNPTTKGLMQECRWTQVLIVPIPEETEQ